MQALKNDTIPSHILVELGRLCHHTFNGAYAIPKNYFLIAQHGVGPSLAALLENPTDFNGELISNWEKQCEWKISSCSVALEGFLDYVKAFDFSIVKNVNILTVIEEHEKTIYHAATFGGNLRRYRDIAPDPANDIGHRELIYVTELYKVYAEKPNIEIKDADALKKHSPHFHNHFYDQRKSFYCTESLEVFCPENFPDYKASPFDELKADAYILINNETAFMTDRPGSERLTASLQAVTRADFSSNPLSHCFELRSSDKAA